MSRIGNPEWGEVSIYHDDYVSKEDLELSPLDDDYVPEKYRSIWDDEYYD